MKKMQKIIAVALVLILALGMTACGGGDTKEDALKVGFIYIGSAKDGGFSEAQDNGRIAMEKEFGGKVETTFLEEVPENAQDVEAAAKNLMDEGCKVIVGTSYGYMDTLDKLAKEYPDNYFLHFSGNKKNDTNFDNYFGAMEEARYLAGIVAGKTTKSNKLGYVAAFSNTEVNIGINAYTRGVQSVNPKAEVNVVYINSWVDAAKEKEAAEALISQGCDVIAQHCDTTGPALAAEAAGVYSIGYNLDKADVAPKAVLTAPIWYHDKYYTSVIQSIMDNKFKPESYYGTLEDGYIGLAPMTDLVSDDVKAEVEKAQKAIIAGDLAPFSGEIKYADGTLLCKEGQTLERADIWKTKGVIEGVKATGAQK
ncbi:MAG: BMP family ABC transporter substrate-binding protein [Anaerovoracaceae bacterium]